MSQYINIVVKVNDIFIPPKMTVIDISKCGIIRRNIAKLKNIIRRKTKAKPKDSIVISAVSLETESYEYSDLLRHISNDAKANLTLVHHGKSELEVNYV